MGSAYGTYLGSPDGRLFGMEETTGGFGLASTDLGTLNNGIGNTLTSTGAVTVTDIGYHQGTTTGTPSAGSYTAELQTLTTNGLPSGTRVGGTATTTFTPTNADDNKWVWVTLSANYTLTRGQEFAVVIYRSAATDAANKITANGGTGAIGFIGMYGMVTESAGTWTKSTGGVPLMAVRTSTANVVSGFDIYGRTFSGGGFIANVAFGGTTEFGIAFTLPTNFCSTYKLRGIRWLGITPTTSATNTFVVSLYKGSPESGGPIGQAGVLVDQSIAILTDRFYNSSNGPATSELYFTTSTALTAGNQYVIGLATTTANDGGAYCTNQVSAADWNAWPLQQLIATTSRVANSYAAIVSGTATGNWAATTATRRPWIDLILEDLTAPSGGTAGMLYVPNLAGT